MADYLNNEIDGCKNIVNRSLEISTPVSIEPEIIVRKN